MSATGATDLGSDTALVIQAYNDCAGARVNNRRHSPGAYECAAEAALLLGQHGPTTERGGYTQQAICNYAGLAHLSSGSRPNERQRRYGAQKGLGDALRLRADGRQDLSLAIAAYRAASGGLNDNIVPGPIATGRHNLLLSLARALRDAEEYAPAEVEYQRLLALPPYGGANPDRFHLDALVELARLRERLNRSVNDRLSLWRQAYALRQLAPSGEVNVEFGKLLLDPQAAVQPSDPTPQRLFEDAVAMGPSPGPVNFQLEGYYNLSLLRSPLGASPRAGWAAASEYAKQAGNSQASYRRQACLSHIAYAGGEDGDYYLISRNNLGTAEARRRDAEERASVERESVHCLGVDTGPEGQLLRGMYWLRRAQWYFRGEDQTWNNNLDAAESAFRAGLAQLGTANPSLDWPREPAQGVTLSAALRFGSDVVAAYSNRCQRRPISTLDPAYPLFAKYDLATCRPRSN